MVCLVTDDSCLGNPGPGGWACLLRFGGVKGFGGVIEGVLRIRSPHYQQPHGTPIQGLLALIEPCDVEINTDSEYVLHGITKWIVKWKRGHWAASMRRCTTPGLWMELDEFASLQAAWDEPEATPATKTAPAAIGHKMRQTPCSSWPEWKAACTPPRPVPRKPLAGPFR